MKGILALIVGLCIFVGQSSATLELDPTASASAILLWTIGETEGLILNIEARPVRASDGGNDWADLNGLKRILAQQKVTAQKIVTLLPRLENCLQRLTDDSCSAARTVLSASHRVCAVNSPVTLPQSHVHPSETSPFSSPLATKRMQCGVELYRAEHLLYTYESAVELVTERMERLLTLKCPAGSLPLQLNPFPKFESALLNLYVSLATRIAHYTLLLLRTILGAESSICFTDFAPLFRHLQSHTQITTLAAQSVKKRLRDADEELSQIGGLSTLLDTLAFNPQGLGALDIHGILESSSIVCQR